LIIDPQRARTLDSLRVELCDRAVRRAREKNGAA
jgi:hypothetical protein